MDESTDAPEEWRPVVGYEGAYEVSSLGRVRSIDRWMNFSDGRRPVWRAGQLLAASPNTGYGHLKVRLCAGKQARTHPVHKLVANAFLGPCPPRQEVCHGPGGKWDNRAVNLTYGTHSDNMRDRRRDGTDWKDGHWRDGPLCARGHLKASWNIAPSDEGRRRCLACTRGRVDVDHALRRRGEVLDIVAESDHHFVLLVAEHGFSELDLTA